ncbi:MAG TPA: hypothetical protein VK907_07995 [Phnomibacter sp.]|nr:hypothetical protein [Phnomibacter sp.]
MAHNAFIRICIAPFENLSLLPETDTFARSFTADLVTELSRSRQFSVTTHPAALAVSRTASPNTTPRPSAFPDPDLRIAGKISMVRETLRINLQLFHPAAQQLIWGQRFELPLQNMADGQETLLMEMVGVLQQEINAYLLSQIRREPEADKTAYEYWLLGMEALKRGQPEADLEARTYFEAAIALQPDLSLAYTGMSLSYFNEWSCQLWDRWQVAKCGAYEWAQKAIELDDRSYIAAMVIGKIFLYEGSYQTAEFYFRQSLRLNPNDPETAMQIATYFVYLGLQDEAEALFERVLRLFPLLAGRFMFYGAFIYFEKGDFEKAATMVVKHWRTKWADADVYNAAIHYYMGHYEKMQDSWTEYLNTYRRLIAKDAAFREQDAIDWLRKINPYKDDNNRLEGFLRFMERGDEKGFLRRQGGAVVRPLSEQLFLKEGATWRLQYEGNEVVMPEVKGFFDIARLLAEPGKMFHCAELMGSVLDATGEKLFDQKAKKQYEQRLLWLQKAMHDAEQHTDFETLEVLQNEYDELIDHLSGALGLKGKVRKAGDAVEKARSAVTWRIRHAIARIEGVHPHLGAHLGNAIKTGTFCTYQPDRELYWVAAQAGTAAARLTM